MHREHPPTLNWIRSQCRIEGDCWIWQRSRNSKGYGKLKHQGQILYVHRIVYELVYREVADQVMHSCDVRLCCNPAHLSTGTNMENVLDCIAKDRHTRGERHGSAKLTKEDVLAIRENLQPQLQVAKSYGVDQTTISDIILRKTWKHLT